MLFLPFSISFVPSGYQLGVGDMDEILLRYMIEHDTHGSIMCLLINQLS